MWKFLVEICFFLKFPYPTAILKVTIERMVIMLNELINMNKDVKNFLCETIFRDRVATQSEIIELATQEGYEENEIYRALDIFLYNSLIDQTQGIMPPPVRGDFLISDVQYHEFKIKGYL